MELEMFFKGIFLFIMLFLILYIIYIVIEDNKRINKYLSYMEEHQPNNINRNDFCYPILSYLNNLIK